MSGMKYRNPTTGKWEKVGSVEARDIKIENSNIKATDVDGAFTEIKSDVNKLTSNVAWLKEYGTNGNGNGNGNSGATGEILTSVVDNPLLVSTTSSLSINYMIKSRLQTNFFITLKLDNQSSIDVTIKPNQWYTWNVGRLIKGSHTLFLSARDVDMLPLDPVTINVVSGALELSSTFNDKNIFNVSSDINIQYMVNSYLTDKIDLESKINLTPQPVQRDIPKDRQLTYNIGKRPVGVYNVEIEALSGGFVSNKLEYTINVASTDQLFLSVNNNIQKTFNRGIPIKFIYTIAVLGYSAFITHYEIDGKKGSINSRLGQNMFEIPSDDISAGTHILKLTANDADNVIKTTEDLEIEILIKDSDFTPWEPVKSGLIAHFKARGIDSSFTNSWENSVKNSPITCKLNGINGTSNGFIGSSTSSNIDKSLVINGEAYGVINYTPFIDDNQPLTNGVTINVLYRTKNVGNKNARAFDCARYNAETDLFTSGLYANTEDALLRTMNISTGAKIGENEWINQTFVIDDQFLRIYNKGTITSMEYHGGIESADSITHDGLIYLGGRLAYKKEGTTNIQKMLDFADCDIKDVKIYNRALSPVEVVYNYIGDDYYLHTTIVNGVVQFDIERQKRLRELNSMSDDGVFKVDTTATSPFPIVEIKFTDNDVAQEFREYSERTVWGENDNKFKQFPCLINYSDHANKRYLTNHIGYITLQGTSSTGYTSKNYEIYLGKTSDGTTNYLYSPRADWLPENQYTLKCNMMDSSHANNVGTGRLINSGYFRDPIPPKVDPNNNNRTKVKDAVDGFPIILEIAMGRVNNGGEEDNYMGIYTFNMGRGSFYNLGLKNADFIEDNGIVTSFTDKLTGLYDPDRCFAYEVSTSNNNGAGAFKQQSDEWIRSEFERRYPLTDNLEAYKQLKNAVVKTSSSGTPVEVTDLKGNPIKDSQGNPVMTPSGLQFREQSCWNLPSLADYLILSYMLGMVDNLGKNLLLKAWNKVGAGQESVWYTTFYDMDTILGLDNVGLIKHGSDVDMDSYPTGDFIEDQKNPLAVGKGDYNLSDSRLWKLYREFYYGFETKPEEELVSFNLLQRYTNLRKQGILTYENIIDKYMSVIDSIGQNYYNRDAEIKYMNKTVNKDGVVGYHNLTFLHGTREYYTKLWLKRRFTYLDSIFSASSNQMAGNTSAKGLKFRFNVGGQAIGNRIINVSTVSTTFVTVHWKGEDDANDFSKLLVKQGEFKTFQKTFSAGTQSTNMNFGPEIMYLDGLNVGNPSYLDLSNASNLISLDLGGNSYLQAINLDGCVSLRTLILRKCSKLGEGASEDPRPYINLSACLNLQVLDISETKLLQVRLPKGGTLKSFKCNDTLIQEIDLSNQSFLEEVDLSNCTNLSRINLSNCANIKKIILTNTALSSFLASNCPKLEEVNLSNSGYLTSINFNLTPEMKTLRMDYCNNSALTELNLIGCPKLEVLEMNSCSAKKLRFNENSNNLKRLICSNSNIESTIFGSNDGDVWLSNPSVDLKRFTTLTAISFSNCKSLKAITNLNMMITNGSSTFANCSNLLRITGNLRINGTATSMFYNCPLYKINDTVVSNGLLVMPNDNVVLPFNLDLTTMTSASNMFALSTSIDLGHAYYFLRRSIAVTTLSATFQGCTGIKTTDTQLLPENIFEKCTRVVSINSVFHTNGNMGGALPQKVLWNMKQLRTAYRAFSGCKFTYFDQSTLFESVLLTDATEMFNGNSFNNSVFSENLFPKNKELTLLESTFNGCANFGVILKDDMIFRFNSKLTSIQNAFNGCKVSGRLHGNIFGGIDPNKTGVENGITVNYTFPLSLTSIGGAFNNSSITGELHKDLFKNLTKLQYANNVFSNSGITGEIPEELFKYNIELLSIEGFFRGLGITGQIPDKLLWFNKKLTNVGQLFSLCLELTSTIPDVLFRYNSQLFIVNSLFSGSSKLSGIIPNDLFKTLDTNNLEVPLRVTDGSGLFTNCFGLRGSIPEGLFRYMPNLTTLLNCFYNCGTINNTTEFGLTGAIPEGLLYGLFNLVNIDGLLYRCNKLDVTTVEPENPLDPVVLNMIPRGFFRDNNKITSARNAFAYINNGGQIPYDLFNTLRNITDMSYMFYNSMRNQKLDSDLFKYNNKLSNISFMFSNDSTQGSATWNQILPSDLFKKYVTTPLVSGNPLRNVTNAFARNTALKGNSIRFWEFGSVLDTTSCYYNDTSLSDYSTIPNTYK